MRSLLLVVEGRLLRRPWLACCAIHLSSHIDGYVETSSKSHAKMETRHSGQRLILVICPALPRAERKTDSDDYSVGSSLPQVFWC